MSAPESLESLAESFGRVLYIEGKADRTLVLYGQSVRYFCAWLTAQGQPTDLTSLTRDNVADWLESLRRRRLSDGTVLTRWRGPRRPRQHPALTPVASAGPLPLLLVAERADFGGLVWRQLARDLAVCEFLALDVALDVVHDLRVRQRGHITHIGEV